MLPMTQYLTIPDGRSRGVSPDNMAPYVLPPPTITRALVLIQADRSRRGRSPKVGGGQASMISSNINLLNTSTPLGSQHMSSQF